MGDALHGRGILYAPDFVINAGGVINIGEELGQPYDADRARTSVERIADTLRTVFARAKADGVPTHIAADRLAEERIAAARAADPDPLSAPPPGRMIPLHDSVPTRRRPILTIALIVANLAVFVWSQNAPTQVLLSNRGPVPRRRLHRRDGGVRVRARASSRCGARAAMTASTSGRSPTGRRRSFACTTCPSCSRS